uniref:Trafficking protein particle complex subunit 11 domain-containing protein n=1 Tax=Wuchereria bancrofti TaxID=6293 RepID=A0AAF5Q0J7_WUCBA
MLGEQIRQGFSPLLAVLTSDAVERIATKNNLSFTDLLLPFATVNCTVKDPSGSSVTSRIFFDFRDLRRDGFLLSLTVLPSVLHEAASSVASTSDSDPGLASIAFSETLLKWSEPAEHEFLRTYLGCIFVVSTDDEDPVEELSKLIDIQHQQQYGQNAFTIGPAYCAMPRWMLPNIFKYFLILDDESSGNGSSRASSVFSAITTQYGIQNCYLLKMNSKYDDELTDPWRAHLESKYRGLKKGLQLAKYKVLSKTVGLTDGLISSNDSPVTEQNNDGFTNFDCVSNIIHGQYLSYDDRESVTKMMECMIHNALLPWVERQMRTLNEQVIARRGISKSLTTGVRKWFGTAASQQATSITYARDSGEMQVRLLADLCFIFGLYSYAYQLYQTVRKEFAVDQAWLYNAGALEMAALSLFLSTSQITAKQYPQHYMDDAINFYTTVSLKPVLTMRAAILSALILSTLELYVEACTQLLKLTNSDDDLFSGILLERASVYFGNAKMRRKMAFHYVLAGHRMSKAGQKQLSMECYKRALPEYLSKRWVFAEDHILYTLANESDQKEEALSWCLPLIKSQSVQHPDQQQLFLKHYLQLLKHCNSIRTHEVMVVPLVDIQNIAVIYGERPIELIPELITNVETLKNNKDMWVNLSKAAYFAITGSFAGFRETGTVHTASTDNSKIPFAPPLERMRIILSLKNPLDIPLILENIHLEVLAEPTMYMQTFTDKITLEPKCDWIPLELSVIPKKGIDRMRVHNLSFNLVVDEINVTYSTPLSIRGPRMNNSKKEKTSILYGEDYRLTAEVTKEQWPLVEIDLPLKRRLMAFCGQICRFNCDVSNIGVVPVEAFCIVTDHPELISVYEEECPESSTFGSVKCTTSVIDVAVGVFNLKHGAIAAGQKKRLQLAVRAPTTESLGLNILLVCYYRGDNCMIREQRHVIVIDARVILETSLRLVDRTSGACVLQLRNLIPNRSSLLAKIELIKIRLLVAHSKINLTSKTCQNSLPQIFLHPLQRRRVELESEQTDSIPFLTNGHEGAVSLWFCDEIVDIPEWSSPPDRPSEILGAVSSLKQCTEDENTTVPQLDLFFAILWKANVVNSDGTTSTVFGENFIPNPFPLGYSVPFCTHHILRPFSIEQSNQNLLETKRVSSDKNLFAFICKISTSSPITYHNFSNERSCQIPVQITITNDDFLHRRSCTVTIHFLDSTLIRKQMVDSGSTNVPGFQPQNTASSSSYVHSSLVLQPLIIADRSRMHATIAFGCTQIFNIRLTVYCPSIYDISRFQAVGLFDGDRTEVPIYVPPTYITVIDQRV